MSFLVYKKIFTNVYIYIILVYIHRVDGGFYMESREKVKKMIYAAVLTAIAIMIPLQFGFLKIQIPPFSATLASHVPMFLAMLISPAVAVFVGIGSAFGFFITATPEIAARAAMHIIVGFIGAKIVQKDKNFTKAITITGPIHGILEGLAVIPFGFTYEKVLIVVALGTLIHHFVDGAISYALAKSLAKARRKNLYDVFSSEAV